MKILVWMPDEKTWVLWKLEWRHFYGFSTLQACLDLPNLMLSLSAAIKAWMVWTKLKPYLPFTRSMWPYSQALPSAWQVKIQLYFLYIAIAAMLQKKRFSGREEINLKLITSSALVLSLLMSECIKHAYWNRTYLWKWVMYISGLTWAFDLWIRTFSVRRLWASNVLYFREKAKANNKWQLNNSFNSGAFIILCYAEE